jgi:cytochrome c-type biogenesis protein CcmE
MTPRGRRAVLIVCVVAAMGGATALVANAFRSNLVFFYSPSQVMAKESPAGRTFRLGGLVERGSLKRDGLTVRFFVSDTVRKVPVRYEGILPDLFKEGRGCVAQGHVGTDGVFYADQVLAKHDENYRAPEVVQSIDKAKQATQAAKDAARTIKE